MTEARSDERRVVQTLLEASGIPVPDRELDKLVEMYSGAASARVALREPDLGETEPTIVYAPKAEVNDA